MIQSIAGKFRKHIAYPLFVLFYLQTIILPLHAAIHSIKYVNSLNNFVAFTGDHSKRIKGVMNNNSGKVAKYSPAKKPVDMLLSQSRLIGAFPDKTHIGGPNSPEASAFKAVGSDNLVNLFTGDFSYSIPLLDVGGYPVNLFYSGGVSMEQEASWVGLGWNINPGTVNRNMRGVPDDFNGEDKLIQTQNVKPNRTWGGEVGYDFELLGWKQPRFNASLGFSYNNYLGPALDLGAGVSLTIPITESIKPEKGATKADTTTGLSASVKLNAKLSSRSGLTLSPSLNASLMLNNHKDEIGVGISTGYNSRQGIKELNLSMSTTHITKAKEDKKKDKDHNTSGSLGSSSITFARPSYMPTLRMPMQYSNYSGQLEFGAGMFGIRGATHAQGYYSESKVPVESRVVYKPLVGFIYSDKAVSNKDAVMDFNRVNDGEVTPTTPILSAPQYAYDIFSIQGEGTGGTIRAYRGDLGFMKDNETVSKDDNFSLGADFAPAGHFGMNWNVISTPTRVGNWEDGNNLLLKTLTFKPKKDNSVFENVYFRNPGEATVSDSQMIARIGGDNLVRFKLSGSSVNPLLESRLEQFDKVTVGARSLLSVADTSVRKRDKRSQVTTMLTGQDAALVGLDRSIKNYSGSFNSDTTLEYSSVNRVGDFRKAHHISEIDVLEQSGMKYVYGLPAYNIKQKDFTFSVENIGNTSTGLVSFYDDEPGLGSRHMNNKDKLDGYVMAQETPAYAASFLLTGLLSPDYVDVTGDGITEDDLGGAVKFDYNRSDSLHRWRTPRNNSTAAMAHFNEGLKSERKDNKATITYGEREVWYLNAIESKSMVAVFKTEWRNDAKGVKGEMDGRVNTAENANKRLKQIDLYTKAEIKAKGIAAARPVKTVHFTYAYTLCKGTPDNINGEGKLTLRSVYFTYNGQAKLNKERYVFNYGDTTATKDNPIYAYAASDKWGTYKNPAAADSAANPASLNNMDYPYTSKNKTRNDEYAAAWSLKKILLPSGGQMEVTYEADDYAYVQNRRACDMFALYGLGNSISASTGNELYKTGLPAPGAANTDNFYVYIKIPKPLSGTTSAAQRFEIQDRYLQSLNQLAFKILINMPKGPEPLTVYATYDDYGLCSNSTDKDIIYVHLVAVDGYSPLVKSAIGFITGNLPGQAFDGYEVEVNNVKDFLDLAGDMLKPLSEAFKNVDEQMRSASPPKARTIVLNKSFVRLDNPYKMKYGGGVRVKKVIVKDNWQKMLTGSGGTTYGYTSTYGQEYDYTTTEKINGKDTVVSSGVASYETGMGSEENPFREIVSFSNKMPLASAQYGAIEMPMLEAFFTSPGVGYSKVTVRSIHRKGTHGDSALRSAIGKQVTEFFTARDYPAYAAYTPMNRISYHNSKPFPVLYKELTDREVTSQGFLVETNDMHGKMKSQIAYSASDEKTPLTYSYHYYKNTGKNGLNDKVDFVHNDRGGAITPGNMGIDMELMTDVREFKVQANGFNGQIQTDFFTFVPFPFFLIPMLPIRSYTENKYRAVTCTKLVNYHAIEDSVVVMDKGSVISTKTILYDAETGAPVVTKTANEFNDAIYNTSYPAYWAYSAMGPAYKNIDEQFSGASFTNGQITIPGKTSQDISDMFESGDELYITNQGSTVSCYPDVTDSVKIWAYDSTKNTTTATATLKQLVFMDSKGHLLSRSNVSCRIIRSGKRNNLGATIFSLTSMASPIKLHSGGNTDSLHINDSIKVISASAVNYKEKWQVDNDIIKRYATLITCGAPDSEVVACDGHLLRNLNPYVLGLIGNYKPFRSYTYYGERNESDPSSITAIRKNGYLKDFKDFWFYDHSLSPTTALLLPDLANSKWVWNSELTKVNSKGQEIETKDPLNRYTAAQYGFFKNMPVAMTQNAKYGESFAEGFEDYGYKETVNSGVTESSDCLNTQYISFNDLNYGDILNTNDYGFKAHTGLSALKVATNQEVVKSIRLRDNDIDSYNLRSKSGVVYGDTFSPTGSSALQPGAVPTNPGTSTTITYSNMGMSYLVDQTCPASGLDMMVYNSGNNTSHYYRYYITTQNMKVNTSNTYSFNLYAQQGYDSAWHGIIHTFNRAALIVEIKNANDSTVLYDLVYSDATNSKTVSAYLACGYYKVYCYVSSDITVTGNLTCLHFFHAYASYTSDLTGVTGFTEDCNYTKPIAANDSMLNAVFALKTEKKMQFSAWVREYCDTPCTKSDYTYSNLQVWANGTALSGAYSRIKRTGAIIDGWQKVEGEFTVPSATTSVDLHFINGNTTKPMYVDDIRIHPFNANMKSYVFDPRTLRLSAELDENNYATYYEYDEEGQLIRVKKETSQGVKTINETRSTKQRLINDLQ